ncbi:MAG TPA: acyl-CoA thioesterase [Cyclobacteriaceae bacterium]|nr:acyl-CoA thioesterase [Cyclobacteriaceae bacterium]
MERIKKFARESKVSKSEILLPNDTNMINTLMGGRLMHWMDVIGAISAQKHSNSLVVTVSVDNISFRNPIHIGQVVTLQAQVSRAFNTSMEVYIKVVAEDIPKNVKFESNSAFFTFVAINNEFKPLKVPDLIPETEEEIELFNGALRRRELRLILANRMKPGDASELNSILKI